ncbi:MAG: hypothetical protein KDB03_22920 [Planctomycetales bacterium]|nr:hypothetical protein [Planctomycetales bacterium]
MSDHWKSLANLLGTPGIGEPDNRTPSQAAQPEETGPASAGSTPPTPTPTREVSKPIAPPKESALPKPEEATKKKRTSWDNLAKLFNIRGVADSATVPPPAVETEAPSIEAVAETVLHLHESAETTSNTVLDEMFGEAPRQAHDAWQSPRRMVDDLGWDDDDLPSSSPVSSEESLDRGSSAIPEAPSDEVESSGRERQRRSRRRRRRGSPDADARRESSTSHNQSDGEWTQLSAEDRYDDIPSPSEISGWGETKSNEFESSTAEDDEQPLRRSSRRRRGRARSGEEDREIARQPSRDADVAPDSDIDSDEDAPREPREDRSGRRTRRTRSGSRSERQEKVRGHDISVDDDDDDDLTSDRDGESRHRNIPTWLDALNPLIDGNIENHRRNESRGSRGRPRGRR